MTTNHDRKIPLLIGGIVVAGVLLVGSVGVTAIAAGHARMGVFDGGPVRVQIQRGGPGDMFQRKLDGLRQGTNPGGPMRPGPRYVVPGGPGQMKPGMNPGGNVPSVPSPSPTDIPPAG